MSAFTAALAVGHPGHGGSVTGLLFSTLAVAAFARIAFVTLDLPKHPAFAQWLPMAPALLWTIGTLAVAVLAARRVGTAAAS